MPDQRPSNNPWPEQPLVYKKTYAQEEGGTEEYSLNTNAFVDEDGDGKVDYLQGEKVEWIYDKQGNRKDKNVLDADLKLPADLVLIAIGFEGAETGPFEDTDLQIEHGTFKTDEKMQTNVPNVFAAGDANMGQSLVVWAIGEGRDAAHQIDKYLQGETTLPRSVRTINGPDTASVDKSKLRVSN